MTEYGIARRSPAATAGTLGVAGSTRLGMAPLVIEPPRCRARILRARDARGPMGAASGFRPDA